MTTLEKRHDFVRPSVTEASSESNPRGNRDGNQMADLSDEVIQGTTKSIETTRSFRPMAADKQWNPDTLRMFVGVPWNPWGLIADSPGGIRKSYITRSLVQERDGCSLPRRLTSPCAKVSKTVSRRLRSRETAGSATCSGATRRVGTSG